MGQRAGGLMRALENNIAQACHVYREALPSLTVSVKTLGRGSSVRAARARMYMVSRALASLGLRGLGLGFRDSWD